MRPSPPPPLLPCAICLWPLVVLPLPLFLWLLLQVDDLRRKESNAEDLRRKRLLDLTEVRALSSPYLAPI